MKSEMIVPAIAWMLLTFACLLLVVRGINYSLYKSGWQQSDVRRISKGTAGLLLAWVFLLLVLAKQGFFADMSLLPPRPALAILLPLPVVLWFSFSRKGTQLILSIPPQWIIWLQSFRIVVEVLLLLAFIKGKLPVQMTFEGLNFDILSGVLAIPTGFLLARKGRLATRIAIVYNLAGILLLLNILVIAVLSMPTPLRYFMNEPSNTIVGQFPYILLPGVLVPLAYSLHIFSLRQLIHPERPRLAAFPGKQQNAAEADWTG
jgi:hypothetical protein